MTEEEIFDSISKGMGLAIEKAQNVEIAECAARIKLENYFKKQYYTLNIEEDPMEESENVNDDGEEFDESSDDEEDPKRFQTF